MKKFPHSRSKKNIKALAQIRGAASGVRFAEAFYLYGSTFNNNISHCWDYNFMGCLIYVHEDS